MTESCDGRPCHSQAFGACVIPSPALGGRSAAGMAARAKLNPGGINSNNIVYRWQLEERGEGEVLADKLPEYICRRLEERGGVLTDNLPEYTCIILDNHSKLNKQNSGWPLCLYLSVCGCADERFFGCFFLVFALAYTGPSTLFGAFLDFGRNTMIHLCAAR